MRGNATKQGVRDLNGPRLNGTGYNGRVSASCAHHRAPDLVPTHVVEKVVQAENDFGMHVIKTQRFTHCSACGAELYPNDGEG